MRKRFLVIGIVLLFVCMSFNPSTAFDNPISSGNTLYVGGSGEGNYTRIQDAIDNSSDGDTVFVYDDRSPYFEKLIIKNHSINLIGEDKNTTVIDGQENGSVGSVIFIDVDYVTVSGFTIQNCTPGTDFIAGIKIGSNFNNIIGNNVCFNSPGIELIGDTFGDYSWCNVIRGNTISNNVFGISVAYNNFTEISDNIIDSNIGYGVYFGTTWPTGGENNYCNITGNIISNNSKGIYMLGPNNHNFIRRNTIQKNSEAGVKLIWCDNNRFEENNFINNGLNEAIDEQSKGNVWSKNFWDNWIGLKFSGPIMKKFPKIIPGFLFPKFDWHPAQEPYDI